MNKVIISTLAAALALGATAASAKDAIQDSQAELDRLFAKERVAESAAGRQVTSGTSLGLLDGIFDADVRFGVTDIAPAETGVSPSFRRSLDRRGFFGIGGNN